MRPLEEHLTHRLDVEEELEGGWANTIVVEPLTALAGGILGGIVVSVLGWRAAWRIAEGRDQRAGGYVAPKARRV